MVRISAFCRKVLAALSLLFACGLRQDLARAQGLGATTVVPAVDGILKAFQNHPLVAIGDDHNSAQEEDFYAALVRDPRFPTEAGNVVVEFGGAAHQDILDRYLNGQRVHTQTCAKSGRTWPVGYRPLPA